MKTSIKIYGVLFGLVLTLGNAWCQAPEQQLKLGNELYAQQKFNEALETYHILTDSSWSSASLFYNMGNTYFRLGENGKAILYYEKALKLSPKDPDIQYNLNFAKQNLIDVFEDVPQPVMARLWEGTLNLFSSSAWAIVGLLFTFLGMGLLIYFLIQKTKSTLSFSMYAFSGVLGVLLLFLGYSKNQLDNNRVFGVLTIANTYVKSEPEQGQDLFIIHEGTKALIEEEFGTWKKVRFSDGQSGWISNDGFEEI